MKANEVETILHMAKHHIRRACELDGRGRTGGVLCVVEPDGLVLRCVIGVVDDPAKIVQYFTACQEKAMRLLANPGHVSSWQSRDFDNKKYGGAIRSKFRSSQPVIAFSGLSEHLDEAFSAAIAWQVPGMSISNWKLIQRVSQNPFMGSCGLL